MKSKILYCMQVPWGWIKQRPQFIAEGLSKFNDITVVDRLEFKKGINDVSDINLYHLKRLPFERIHVIRYLNSLLYKLQYYFLLKNKDIVWITSPLQYKNLKSICKGKTIIYDCMDDMPALAVGKQMKKETLQYEKLLYNRADIILATSNHLKNHLINLYGKKTIHVVNNAINERITQYRIDLPQMLENLFYQNYFNITYIGTISEWFDFELIKKMLKRHPNIVLHLFGPKDVDIPQISQIRYHGSVKHEFILGIMKKSQALIMPFVVTDLIQSVNPVKLYEYIYSGIPCIAPQYGESLQFNDYVYLYKNESEFENIITYLENKGKNKQEENVCQQYALNNTWSGRINEIIQILNHTS